eukprot:548821-Amorphochlora_amoeboformis.AAC.1
MVVNLPQNLSLPPSALDPHTLSSLSPSHLSACFPSLNFPNQTIQVHRKQVRPKPNLMRSITSSAATSANLNTSKRKFPRPPPRTDRRNESGDMEGPVEGAVEGPVKGILGFVDKKEEAGST